MDFKNCEDEPIRVPESIQPHGLLMVLEKRSERVVRSAGDAHALLDRSYRPLGRSFRDLAGISIADFVRDAGVAVGPEPFFLGSVQGARGVEFDVLAHERGEQVVVELEPSLQDRTSAARLLTRVRAGVAAISKKATLEAACEAASDAIRSLSHHDRVVVYQFIDDSAGKVVAESRADTAGSFRNQHFPATDVPQQARALYLQNLIRVIPNVNYQPQSLWPAANAEPLDMSECSLRSVSPVHIQYLKNMGVASSMSASIVVRDKLWGLIACHGERPTQVPYEMREACKHIATALAHRIESLEEIERFAESEKLADQRAEFLAQFEGAQSLEIELQRRLAELMQLIPSAGLIVCLDGKVHVHGIVPPPAQCQDLCTLVSQKDPASLWATSTLSSQFEDMAPDAETVSGVLAITVGPERPLQILWLRPEYRQTIEWAGHSHKEPSRAGDTLQQLTPRASFAAWRETVSGQSQPWSGPQTDSARRLGDAIEQIRVRQSISLLQAQLVHLSRVNAMGTMASAIAHELNQPLTIVNNYVGGLTTVLRQREDADPETLEMLERVSEQSLKAGEIIRHLRRLVASSPMKLEPHVARKLVESACSLALLDARGLGIRAVVEVEGERRVLADPVQIQQVLLNLIRNSIEAMANMDASQARKLMVQVKPASDGFVEFRVSDSGPGLPEESYEHLFSAFNTTKEGGLGIGLSVCRTIIEAHGGKISGGTSASGGAIFAFTLQEEAELG